MPDDERTAGGESQRAENGRSAAGGPGWTPSKKPVPADKTPGEDAALPRIRARVLAEMGAVVERLEQTIGGLPPIGLRPGRVTGTAPEARRAPEPDAQPEDALERFDALSRRIGDAAARLALVAERFEERLSEQEAAGASELPREQVEHAVDVVVAPVLDFHGLMEMQRALGRLPAAGPASVTRYRNGEASFEVLMRAQMSADQIVQGLRESTGEQLLIEEWRPDEQHLRVRWIEQVSATRDG